MKKIELSRYHIRLQPDHHSIGVHRPDFSRLVMLQLVLAALFTVIGIRLFMLQIVQGKEMLVRSDNNRIVERAIPAPRGVITDRNGVELVLNKPVALKTTNNRNQLLIEAEKLSRQEALQLEASKSSELLYFPGRFYPFGPTLAHVVGYVAESTRDEVDQGLAKRATLVGRSGIEKQYNDSLTGQDGTEVIETDASGVVLQTTVQKPVEAGNNVELSIDLGLQQKLIDSLKWPGAAVATDPKTGEVLAMVSNPSFDPNVFGFDSEGVHTELGKAEQEAGEALGVLQAEGQPLLNRAIGGMYPPGSTYKIIPSIAALETDSVTASDQIQDEGSIKVDEYEYRNWYYTQYGGTEGLVDLRKALQRSNDIYYYKIGQMIGPEALARWSQTFGLGAKTGIDLPGEVAGLVPTPIWKERVKGERWFLGNTFHMAIGQGDVLATPLQINQMMSVIANGGRLCKPKLVRKTNGVDSLQVECNEIGISADHLTAVKEGLEAACETGGTGYPFFDFDLAQYGPAYARDGRNKVACKTGTAQFYDPEDRTHAWFTIFAPAEEPEIVLTILQEAAGEGSQEAAPIAKQVLEWWFSQKAQINKNLISLCNTDYNFTSGGKSSGELTKSHRVIICHIDTNTSNKG